MTVNPNQAREVSKLESFNHFIKGSDKMFNEGNFSKALEFIDSAIRKATDVTKEYESYIKKINILVENGSPLSNVEIVIDCAKILLEKCSPEYVAFAGFEVLRLEIVIITKTAGYFLEDGEPKFALKEAQKALDALAAQPHNRSRCAKEEILLLQKLTEIRLSFRDKDSFAQALLNISISGEIIRGLNIDVHTFAKNHLLLGECHFKRGYQKIAIDDFLLAKSMLEGEETLDTLNSLVWSMRCSKIYRIRFFAKALALAGKVDPHQRKKIIVLFLAGNYLYQRIQ